MLAVTNSCDKTSGYVVTRRPGRQTHANRTASGQDARCTGRLRERSFHARYIAQIACGRFEERFGADTGRRLQSRLG